MKDFSFKKNKKGELTTNQLVTIIVLILSFAVILFLIFRLDLGTTSNKEICRNSVLLQKQSNLAKAPLDCRTNYVCIGGNCEDFTGTDVESKTKNATLKVIADEIADCWWQFGEGKVNYEKGFVGLGDTGVGCAICSKISFNPNLNQELSYSELYQYMEKTQKSSSQTYLQYLYGISNISSFVIEKEFNVSDLSQLISLDKNYLVVTGVDNRALALKDKILKAYIIPADEIQNTGCDTFITKA